MLFSLFLMGTKVKQLPSKWGHQKVAIVCHVSFSKIEIFQISSCCFVVAEKHYCA